MEIRIRKDIILAVVGYCFYTLCVLIMGGRYNNVNIYTEKDIFILSWIANITFIFACYIVYQVYRNVSIIHIMMLFCYLFNFGDTFFWSLGIHLEDEIGTTTLYSNFHIPTCNEIGKALNYTNLCFILFILGIIIVLLIKSNAKDERVYSFSMKRLTASIYLTSKCVGMIVIPITIIKILKTISYSLTYGYVALYYSDFQLSSIYSYAETLFFPVLVGILIGSNYKKKRLVYLIFALYAGLYLMAGERGNWLYKLVILLWMHHNFYKKIDYKKFIKFFIIGFFSLYIVSFVVVFRNTGLRGMDFNTLIHFLAVEKNPIIDFIFEMGGSIGVTIIVLSLGQNAFIMPNTFVSSLLASFSSGIAAFLGVKEVFLGNYLSQKILKINYGTGFNIFSECYINGGNIGGLCYAFVIGIMMALILKNTTKQTIRSSSVKCVFICSIAPVLCSMFRDSSLSIFKQIVQIGIIYIGLIFICSFYFTKKNSKRC